MDQGFLEIDVEGDAFHRGLMHGRAVREYILPFHGTGILGFRDHPRVRQAMDQSLGYMRQAFPNLVEELKGIAAGAEMDFDDILLLNNRRLFSALRPLACSNLALSATGLGPALVGTVDGGGEAVAGPLIVQRVRPESGCRMIGTVLPGTVWLEKGVNEYGLAVGNSSVAVSDRQPAGLAFHTVYRQALLNCRTTEEAMAFMQRHHQNAHGIVLVLVDGDGALGCLEKSPTRCAPVAADSPWVAAANTFRTAEMRPLEVASREKQAEAERRYQTLDTLAARCAGSATLDDLTACLRYHGEPASICRHGGRDLSHTRESYVLLPAQRAMYVGARGYACQVEMHRFEL